LRLQLLCDLGKKVDYFQVSLQHMCCSIVKKHQLSFDDTSQVLVRAVRLLNTTLLFISWLERSVFRDVGHCCRGIQVFLWESLLELTGALDRHRFYRICF